MAAKSGVGAKSLIVVGVVAAGAVAAVVSGIFNTGSGSGGLIPEEPAGVVAEEAGGSGAIDYNCNLPGTGCPWLEHLPPSKWDTWESEEPVSILDGAHLQGFFRATTPFPREFPYMLWLPVTVGPGGPSWSEVYHTLCAVHPDLGGSGLREVSVDELDRLFVAFDVGEEGAEEGATVGGRTGWYTDDVTRSADEAHIGREPVRMYSLPELPAFVRNYMASQSCGSVAAETTTTKPAETQLWRVTLTGHEIDLMDRYWRLTTRVRGAVRFDYTLQGEFTLRKEDERWVYDSGTVTYAEVGISEEYWPAGSWNIKMPLNCTNCDQVTSGRRLTGEVFDDEVRLTWGRFRPEVKVDAQIIAPCTPMPDCSRWKSRTFESSEFFQRVNGRLLPLIDGAVSAPPVVDPASGLQWLDYTITVLRLDDG